MYRSAPIHIFRKTAALKALLLAAFWCLSTLSATASWGILPIRVISFSSGKSPDRYTIIFEAVTTDYGTLTRLPAKKRRFDVRLRHEPKFGSLDSFREGIRILRNRIAAQREITIGRSSEQGWRPVHGQKGVFETVGLRVHRPKSDESDERAHVIFVHDDRY